MLGFEFRETGKDILVGGGGKLTLSTNSVVENLINTLCSGIGLARHFSSIPS